MLSDSQIKPNSEESSPVSKSMDDSMLSLNRDSDHKIDDSKSFWQTMDLRKVLVYCSF